MQHILKCNRCSKYLMRNKCFCGGEGVPVIPAKFDLSDSYGNYRRQAKKEALKKEGLI